MNSYRRIIPCLDVKDGRVVKGVKFVDLRDAGDPVELAERYEQAGADELVFLDITATVENRDTVVELAARTSDRISIPLTIGGGIRSVEDAGRLLEAGAARVSVSSAAVARPDLIDELAAAFGSDAIVLAVDAGSDGEGRDRVLVSGGSEATELDPVEWAVEGVRRGAGQVLYTSLDRDGTNDGYDLRLTRLISDAVDVPVIASGGAGTVGHLVEAVLEGGADAVLCASTLHFGDFTVAEARQALADAGIPVSPA